MSLYPIAPEYRSLFRVPVMAQATGEHRSPRKGEWFLSGAIVEAYLAPNDLSYQYPIARIVQVKTTTQYHVVGIVSPEPTK